MAMFAINVKFEESGEEKRWPRLRENCRCVGEGLLQPVDGMMLS